VNIIRLGDCNMFGVELPVHVALSEDEEAIQRVLLHEFGHCFFYLSEVVEAIDAGLTEIVDQHKGEASYTDEDAADRPRLVDPIDWFSPSVAADFPYWDDAVTLRLAESAVRWTEHFRQEAPIVRWETSDLGIPDDVLAHARRVRESRMRPAE
jgi:hypothetical protein